MKKTMSILIIAVIIITVSTTTACGGGLSGKYVSVTADNPYLDHEYLFENGKVYNYGTEVGSYKISGNKLTITYTFMGKNEEYEFTLSNDKKSFSQGAYTYVKEGTQNENINQGEKPTNINEIYGKYVNENHSDDYFEFKDGKIYTFGFDTSYIISGDKITITFLQTSIIDVSFETTYTLSADRNSFSDGTTTYVKEENFN